jgi:hypothetical protein
MMKYLWQISNGGIFMANFEWWNIYGKFRMMGYLWQISNDGIFIANFE